MPLPVVESAEPDRDCPRCPRLVAFRNRWRESEPHWHNAPVPTFEGPSPRLAIIGLAPGLRGANATGRPFTGDYAGDLLYETLLEFGLASGTYLERPDDGLKLVSTAITNSVRCVPPENKPTGDEINACRPFLTNTLARWPDLRVLLLLGRIAHDTTLRTLGLKAAAYPFAHGRIHEVPYRGRTIRLADSYHCSRYNTNTGRLTPQMFKAVFREIRPLLD